MYVFVNDAKDSGRYCVNAALNGAALSYANRPSLRSSVSPSVRP